MRLVSSLCVAIPLGGILFGKLRSSWRAGSLTDAAYRGSSGCFESGRRCGRLRPQADQSGSFRIADIERESSASFESRSFMSHRTSHATSVSDPADAQPIVLRAGAEEQYDLRLRAEPVRRIGGFVVDEQGNQPRASASCSREESASASRKRTPVH